MTRTSLLILAPLVLVGCRTQPSAPLPAVLERESSAPRSLDSAEAMAAYRSAGESALRDQPELAARVSFTSGMKSKAVQTLGPTLSRLSQASRLPWSPEHKPRWSLEPHDWERGLRLLGRALAWRIEESVRANDWTRARNDLVTATRLGLDLAQLDSAAATLGAAIAEESRAAIAPHLGRFPAEDLRQLAEGIGSRLPKPGSTFLVDHEERNLLAGVQEVQDAFAAGQLDRLQAALGRDVRPAIQHLKHMDRAEAPAYFAGFAAEARAVADHWRAQAEKPMAEREPFPIPETSRPWKRLARHTFSTLEPGLAARDRLLARSRLLAVSSWCLAHHAKSGVAPKDLSGVSPQWALDPYSGRPLVYLAAGPEFRVYSVGPDGRDDGGDTDALGLSPDTVLDPSH